MNSNNMLQGMIISQNFLGMDKKATETALTQMESSADTYEKALQNESNTLDTMEAIADLYALIADLSEQVVQLKESLNGGNE